MGVEKDNKYLANVGDADYDDEVAKKRSRQLAVKVCQDMCVFALFLTAFTIVVLAAQSIESALLVRV